MQGASLEELFDRYRRAGDACALEEVFDRTAPEVLRLAFHLVGDAEQAEELVQATFLVAIEQAGSYDRSRRLVPWLLGILANRVRRTRASSSRALDPRRLHRPDPEDPAQVSERAELQPVVDRALASMPTPYREVLVAHLVDGKRAAEIARDLERAPGTVRMQILRGLELLRKALPVGLATGALLQMGATTRGLAAVRASVLEHAAGRASAAVLTSTSAHLALGGSIVSIKAGLVALGALTVLTGSWFALRDPLESGTSEPAGISASEAAGVVGEERTPPQDLAQSEEPTSAQREILPAVAANPQGERAVVTEETGWYLTGELRGLSAGTDAREVVLNVFCHDVDGSTDPAAVGAEPDGTFEVDLRDLLGVPGRASRDLYVSANHPRHLVANAVVRVDRDTLARGRSERVEVPVELLLQPAGGVDGRVVAPPGWSLAAIEVGLFPVEANGQPDSEPVRSTELEPDGSFEFRKRVPGPHVVVATAEGLAPAFVTLELPPGGIADAGTLELRAEGAQLAGTVVLPAGAALEGCRVRARRRGVTEQEDDEAWRGLAWSAGVPRVWEQYATTDEHGAFALGGLPPGDYDVSLDDADHTLIAESSLVATAPAEGLILGQQLGRVTVLVSAGGEPLRHAHLTFADEQNAYWTLTDERGEAEVYAPRDRDYSLEASHEGYESAVQELPAADRAFEELRTFDLIAEGAQRATLVLTPRLPDGHGLERIAIRLHPQGSGESRSEELDFDGRQFTLREVAPGRYRGEVEPSEDRLGPWYDTYWRLEPFEIEIVAGREHRQLLLGEQGGRLRIELEGVEGTDHATSCSLRDAAGNEHELRFVSTWFEDNVIHIGAGTGVFLLEGPPMDAYPNLAPGRYSLRAEVSGYGSLERTVDVFAGRTTELTLRFRQ